MLAPLSYRDAAMASEPVMVLQAGDRVVFLGDSITQSGAGPGGYVTLFREALRQRQPDRPIEIMGAGISGNKVPDIQARLDRDVLAKKPTVVVIYIGINDVWHSTSGRGTPRDVYERGLRDVIQRIQAAGARPVLCTPSVIGEKTDGSNPLDDMLEAYCIISRQVAADLKIPLIDLRQRFLDYLRQHNTNHADRGLLTNDTVHLSPAGNQFVADQMLSALTERNPQPSAAVAGGKAGERKLRHVVLLKFKPETTPAQIQEVADAFAALPTKIPEVESLEWGTDNSPEGLARGFTHCFLITFRDEAARAVYLPHPEHQKFVDLLKPRLAEVLVVDYWSR